MLITGSLMHFSFGIDLTAQSAVILAVALVSMVVIPTYIILRIWLGVFKRMGKLRFYPHGILRLLHVSLVTIYVIYGIMFVTAIPDRAINARDEVVFNWIQTPFALLALLFTILIFLEPLLSMTYWSGHFWKWLKHKTHEKTT